MIHIQAEKYRQETMKYKQGTVPNKKNLLLIYLFFIFDFFYIPSTLTFKKISAICNNKIGNSKLPV